MDWNGTGVVVSGGLAVLALGIQQVNRLTDRKRADRDRQQAQRDSAMSSARADRAEVIARRAVEAQEQTAAAQPVRQPWSFEHFQGDRYAIANTGNAPTYDVGLDLGQLHRMRDSKLDHPKVDLGGVITFMTVRTLDVSDDTVTVTWASEPGGAERNVWRRPLPPRPPRR